MWCSTAWPSTRSKLVIRERQRSASAGRVPTSRPSRSALAASVCEHPRRDVAAGGVLDQPAEQQVEREVAGPRADLERARDSAPRLAAERLAELREDLALAELAEVDAPLGVVVVRGNVVVARVRVADLARRWRRAARRRTLYSPAVPAPRTEPEARERSAAGSPDATSSATSPTGFRRSSSPASARSPTCRPRTTGFGATWPCTSGSLPACAGAAVIDMACGEGYGAGVLARRAPRPSSASTPTRRPTSTPACATRAANLQFERDARRDASREPADAVVFLQTIEHLAGPRRGARPLPLTGRRPRHGLRLDPQRADARARRGRSRSDNPWHVHEYRRERVRAALPRALLARSQLLGLFHARKLRVHELRAALGWDRVHAALGLTSASTPASPRRSTRATSRCARRGTPTSSGALDFLAVCRT